MALHVLVLCDDLGELGATSGALDAQTLSPREFTVTYVGRGLGDADRARLDHLVARRPNLAVVHGEAAEVDADRVLTLRCGDVLVPDALERLSAAPVPVLARRVGSASGAVLAASADTSPDGLPLLPEPPVLLPRHDDLPAPRLALTDSSVTWDGPAVVVRATVRPTVDGDLSLVVNGRDAREVVVATGTDGSVDARLVVTTLPDGPWDVWLQVVGADGLERVRVPRHDLGAAIVDGRAVVPTLKEAHLQLQVGRVRRRWFTPVAERATITESATGTALELPLEGLHLAGDEPVTGSLLVGSLRVPATITTTGGHAVLHALLSGLAGEYPLGTELQQVRRMPLGLTLEVDGVGAMRLVRTKRPAAPTPVPTPTGRLSKVREAVPEPVVRGLRRVPGLREWYAGR